ncbi:MAG: transposase [Gemmataceae bacterium]|nr:transposase [Gemmataceae bacterium]
MDRYWLLTNTLYGTWLPGSVRGFVGQVREHRDDDPTDQARVTHDVPGTPCDEDMPGLEEASRERMKGPPLHLTTAHADELFAQFQETARHRGWELRAVAIMFNHFHIVVGVPGDPNPSKILGDFKSWGTRKLSAVFGAPASETWWTQGGSKRKLKDEQALAAAIHYVLYEQPEPLLTWSPETGLHHGLPPRASVEA